MTATARPSSTRTCGPSTFTIGRRWSSRFARLSRTSAWRSTANTLGWFAYNPSTNGTYFARPDNSGRALFRYINHDEISFFSNHLAIGMDTTFFTDSRAAVAVRPSELDITPELIGRFSIYEVHVAYERDMPIDRPGLVQQVVYVLGSIAFDFKKAPPTLTPPTQERDTARSGGPLKL